MAKKQGNNINILMCCSDLSVKGGMVSVVKNYLKYDNWGDINIIYVPTHIEKGKVAKTVYFVAAYVKILALCLGKKIDIAHLHTAERGSFYRKALLVRTCKKFGIKTIMHHHAAEFEAFYDCLQDKKKQYVNRILESTDVNIVLSKRLVSMIIDKAPKAKVEVLYNAVATYKSNPYNVDAKNVLFLGRLGKRKGTYDLLEVIKRSDSEIDPQIKFYLCGDGDIDGVTSNVKELGIQHRIAHIGWIDGEQKAAYLANTCINVLPSYNEGLPMSILETMAYGIPNISTNIASIPEVVKDGENGYIIESGDIRNMKMKLEEIIKENVLRNEFSMRSYNLICDRFSLENHINKLTKLYKNLEISNDR